MRKHWIDNLRWFTVVLVLVYHVFYMFNSKGVLGGIGGFSDNPMKQPQDIVLYILYPWFMMLLFLLAGISARFSLEKRSIKEFVKTRTQKLLVPSTIGLFAFQWIVGYFNTRGGADTFTGMPLAIKWIIYSLVGSGPLWFAQELWVFSLLLILVRKIDNKDKFRKFCSKVSTPGIILLGILIYLGSQLMIYDPDPIMPFHGLVNLYRPLAYLVPFMMGYFVFSNEEVIERVKGMCLPMTACAAIACLALCLTTWGENYTSPRILTSWLNCLYAWLMILSMIGLSARFFDRTSRFCQYMNRTSYGLYVLHYSVIVSFGYMLKTDTTLSPWIIYPLLLLLVFSLTPVLYECIHRIPLVRWAILGEKRN
ncbi:MAG: acyltransferase [Bacteroidales bacterium]|nr:acyltransferase [Bacteroidales bacterium]